MSQELFHTVREGAGPTLVFSHALGMDGRAWEFVLEHLGGRHRTLVFDHLGHGKSPVPPGPYRMEMLVDRAAALLRQRADGPVVWVGLSMGGMVGLGLAIRHPELLQGLVVANSTAYYPESARDAWDERIASVKRGGIASIADAVISRYFHADFRAAQPEAVQRARSTLLASDPAGYVACCHAVRDVDWRSGLARIECPTLVVAGELDVGTPVEMARAMAHGIPGAHLAVIGQCAHISAIERPDEFARLLEEFMVQRLAVGEAQRAAAPKTDYEQGLVHRRRILGDAWVDRSLAQRTSFNAEFQELITRHAWKDIWGRPALGDRTRRYVVLSMLLGLRAWDEFAMHVRAALDAGDDSRLSAEDLKEVILMAAIYCGVPAANHAFGLVGAILRDKGMIEPHPVGRS